MGAVVLAACVAGLLVSGAAQAESGLSAATPASPSTQPHPLDPALKLAYDSWHHSQTHVRDYTAVMTKRVRVDGELGEYQQAFVKIRNRRREGDRVITPMSVYMKFLGPASIKGREVIWVEGRNNGRLVAHEAGLMKLVRVHLDPRGSIAMRGQRYPISDIGLDRLLEQLIEKGKRDRQHGECVVDFFPNAKVDSRSCKVVQIVHPAARLHFDFHRVHVFFDDELKLPVRYASWSWPQQPGSEPPLEEEYNYTKIAINVGLTDLDFDPDNPAYDF
jgi:hypothetical protein